MNKRVNLYREIEQHGKNLKKFFRLRGIDPIELSKKLLRLEKKAHKFAEDYCNGTGGIDSENWEDKTKPVLDAVDKILGFRKKNIPVFLNGDARGYALKIKDDYTKQMREQGKPIYSDWGGYGIIAPDFREG